MSLIPVQASIGGSIRKQYLFAVYQAVIVAFVMKYAAGSAKDRTPYFIGDWLINYRGGFIRRGLPGEVIFRASRIVHLPSAWIVFSLVLCLYLLFQFSIFRMTRTLEWRYALIALMVSPATLAFEALNPGSGIRKEILLFVTLSWIVSSSRIREMNPRIVSAVLTAASVLMVLSHESLLFYFPYILAGLIVRFQDVKKAVQVALIPAVAAAAAAVVVLLHPGDLRAATAVCTSIGGELEPFGVFDGKPCSGAIVWLQETLPEAHAWTWQYVRSFHFVQAYSLLAVLTLLPVLLLLRRLYARPGERTTFYAVAGSALVSISGSMVLFYGATDWGRWIHFHAICLMLLLMAVFTRTENATEVPAALSPTKRAVAAAMVFVYATTWMLPLTRSTNDSNLGGVWKRLGAKIIAHSGRR